MRNVTLAILFGALLAAPALSATEAKDDTLAPKLRAALVKVHVTRQSWDNDSPWNKNNPGRSSQRGFMVRPGLVLTPADGVADHLFVEVSVANSEVRYAASLHHVDYSAGLALVKIEDADLAERMEPLEVKGHLTIDDKLQIWGIGSTELLEGTTGRVQKVLPQHNRLTLIVKTDLADTGNGQVVTGDSGNVTGMVVSTRSSRQEGRVLAVETILHYLEDVDGEEYRGFPSGGLWLNKMLRDDLRDYYRVPEGESGVLVSRVVPGRTGHGAVAAGDVITHLAGHDIDDEGTFEHPIHGRLLHQFLLYGTPYAGDTVRARILRNGEPMEVDLPLRSWPLEKQRVPTAVRDRRPPYMVVGGLVILELTRRSRVGTYELRQHIQRAGWEYPSERKRIIYASRVLADSSNKGLDDIVDRAILTVNGKTIGEMKDVVAALATPQDGYHVFTFEGIETNYVIKAADLEKIDERIAERYRIPELRYLPED